MAIYETLRFTYGKAGLALQTCCVCVSQPFLSVCPVQFLAIGCLSRCSLQKREEMGPPSSNAFSHGINMGCLSSLAFSHCLLQSLHCNLPLWGCDSSEQRWWEEPLIIQGRTRSLGHHPILNYLYCMQNNILFSNCLYLSFVPFDRKGDKRQIQTKQQCSLQNEHCWFVFCEFNSFSFVWVFFPDLMTRVVFFQVVGSFFPYLLFI